MRRRLQLQRLEVRLAPAIWDGGGADANWTTNANWVGDLAPQPGAELEFPAGAARLATFNDFAAGTTFQSIAIRGGGYLLAGKEVSLSAGVIAEFGGDNSTIAIDLSGAGGVTKSGAGRLVLSGDNRYTGITAVMSGFLEVRTSTALGAAGIGNQTSVVNGATLTLNGNLNVAEPIAFAGAGVLQQSFRAGAIQSTGGVITLTGLLILTDTALIFGRETEPFDRLSITGGIIEAGGSFGLQLDVTPLIVFTETSVNSYTGVTEVLAGTAEFDGQGGSGLTIVHGVIAGMGTVGPVEMHGLLAPGRFDEFNRLIPGVLHIGDLDLNYPHPVPTFTLTPGSHSQLAVSGGVEIGPFSGIDGIEVSTAEGYRLQIGDQFTIVDNDETDPIQGTFADLPEGAVIRTAGGELRISYHGGDGNDIVLTAVSRTASAVGAGEGGGPHVRVFDGAGELKFSFFAYDMAFRGGVRVATADLNGDREVEIVTAPGRGGGPHIRIWDGATGDLIREFNAYHPDFRGGVFIAAARLDSDEAPEIITGAGAGGGPHVRVFNGVSGDIVSEWHAYDPAFLGGVSVAGIDVNPFQPGQPGRVITGAGPGGGPHVRVFIGATGEPISEFMAYDPEFSGGVNVAAAFVNGDVVNWNTIVTSPGAGGGPDVRVYHYTGTLVLSYFAYDAAFRGGVTVAIWKPARIRLNAVDSSEILTGAGPGGGPHVEQWLLLPDRPPAIQRSFFAFDPAFTGGIYVG
jgi:autotransporter-associated beta strand protein